MKTRLKVTAALAMLLAGAGIASAQDGSEAAAKPAAAKSTAGWDKGFVITDSKGDFKLKVGARVQARYALESIEVPDADRENHQAFSIPRGRLKLSGHAWSPQWSYLFQADFGKGKTALKDFYIEYEAMPDALILTFGQFKKPFSRQQMTSSGDLELVDRATTEKAFNAGRDVGFMLHDGTAQAFEWAFAVMNGTGDANPHPDDFKPTAIVRLGYNHNGIKGYSEADLEGGPLRFSVGAGANIDLNLTNDDQDQVVIANVDYMLKASGFSSTGGVYDNLDTEALGFHVQAGHVFAKMYQPVVRFAMLMPKDGDPTLVERKDITGGFAIYLYGHKLKWQSDVTAVMLADTTDIEARSQLQLAF